MHCDAVKTWTRCETARTKKQMVRFSYRLPCYQNDQTAPVIRLLHRCVVLFCIFASCICSFSPVTFTLNR